MLLNLILPQMFWFFYNHPASYISSWKSFVQWCKSCEIRNDMQKCLSNSSHEYRCLQCRRHEHSPYHRMFVAVFCRIFWRLVLPLSHLIIHPAQEWSGFWRHFWFCFGVRIHLIVFNNESVRVLCEYNRSPCSIFPQFTRFPLLRRPSFINIQFWVTWWVSVYNMSPCFMMLLSSRAQRKLTFVSGFPRAFWCSRR